MDVSGDGHIEFMDGGLVEFHAGLFFHPGFKLRIGGPVVFDMGGDGIRAESEGADDHHVIAFANSGVAIGEFAARFEGNLLPQAWEMENPEGARRARADQWNNFAHSSCYVIGWVNAAKSKERR